MFFSSLTVILLKPGAVSSFRLFIKSIISLLSTGLKNEVSKDVSYGLLDSICSVLLKLSCNFCPMEVKNSLNVSAAFFGSVCAFI